MLSPISKRAQSIDVSGIRKVFDLSQSLKNPINMSIGQPHFETPTILKKALEQATKENYNQYTPTQGNSILIEKIHTWISEKKNRAPEDVLITSGTSGGIYLAFLALLNPLDEIIIPDPYFVLYKELAILVGAKPILVDTYPLFEYKAESIISHITSKTKAIIINSPANPTGKIIEQVEIDKIIEIAKKHDLYIISDEIYEHFYYQDDDILPSSFEKYNKTILLNGFSKACSTTGWRIGYAAGPKEVISAMKKLQQYTYVCAPAPLQKAIIHFFTDECQELLDQEWKNYKKKSIIFHQIIQKSFSDYTPSQGAFYAFLRAPQRYNDDEFVIKAIKNNVLIIPGSVFSQKNTHFRVSFALSDEKIIEGANILNKIA